MIRFLRNRILAAVFVCSSLGAFTAEADLLSCGVDLGEAGRTKQWAVFTLGNSNVTKNLRMNGSTSIVGDVGAAGNGNVRIKDSAIIDGDLYEQTRGTFTKKNSAKLNGNTFQSAATDALLNQAAMDAQNSTDQAWALPVSPAYSSLTNVDLSDSQNITITGSGCVVLKLQNFRLADSSTFTLAGTAGTSYIINVSKRFSLTDSSKIVLGTGINAADVL